MKLKLRFFENSSFHIIKEHTIDMGDKDVTEDTIENLPIYLDLIGVEVKFGWCKIFAIINAVDTEGRSLGTTHIPLGTITKSQTNPPKHIDRVAFLPKNVKRARKLLKAIDLLGY